MNKLISKMTDDELLDVLYHDILIYDALKSCGAVMDNHYSDLYVKVTPDSTALINLYVRSGWLANRPTTFTCNIDKELWYELPFQSGIL